MVAEEDSTNGRTERADLVPPNDACAPRSVRDSIPAPRPAEADFRGYNTSPSQTFELNENAPVPACIGNASLRDVLMKAEAKVTNSNEALQ